MTSGSVSRPYNYTIQTGIISKGKNKNGDDVQVEVSGTLQNTVCAKIGNIVTVGGDIHTIDNEVANKTYFQLPDGFRPNYTMRSIAAIRLTGDTTGTLMSVPISIFSDGRVVLAYSSSITIIRIIFSATYPTV